VGDFRPQQAEGYGLILAAANLTLHCFSGTFTAFTSSTLFLVHPNPAGQTRIFYSAFL
jgi:hypothetical protein